MVPFTNIDDTHRFFAKKRVVSMKMMQNIGFVSCSIRELKYCSTANYVLAGRAFIVQ